MKRTVKYLLTVGLLACTGCASIPATYTAADRATYNAIAPEYLEYVNEDGTSVESVLTPAQKELRRLTVESWERRIRAAEEAGK